MPIIRYTALYCRISKNSPTNDESNSIVNQKILLQRAAVQYNFEHTQLFVDESIILGLGQEVLVPQGFPGLVLIFMRLRICGPSRRMIEKCVELSPLPIRKAA